MTTLLLKLFKASIQYTGGRQCAVEATGLGRYVRKDVEVILDDVLSEAAYHQISGKAEQSTYCGSTDCRQTGSGLPLDADSKDRKLVADGYVDAVCGG